MEKPQCTGPVPMEILKFWLYCCHTHKELKRLDKLITTALLHFIMFVALGM